MHRLFILTFLICCTFGLHAKAPAITAAPLSKIMAAGQSVSFTVGATGDGSLTYQWKHNGTAITGATSTTLNLPSVAMTDRGYYEVVVTNAEGSAKSVFRLDVGVADASIVSWASGLALPAGKTQVLRLGQGFVTNYVLALNADGTVAAWSPITDSRTTIPQGLGNVVAVASGRNQSVALKADGTVVVWGVLPSTVPQPTDLGGVVAIAAGNDHVLAIKSDGSVVAWGGNSYSQCTVPTSLSDVVAVAAGDSYSVAVKSDGSVVTWGNTYYLQSTQPTNLSGVIAVASGFNHCLALRSDGTVVAWGTDYAGSTEVPAGLNGVLEIAAGSSFSMALKTDGTVVAWGRGYEGQTTVPTGLGEAAAIACTETCGLALVASRPPSIKVQPAGSSTTLGDYLTLSVEAQGTVPFTYQWKKNGSSITDGGNISGTTSSTLKFAAVSAIDAGDYSVIITNRIGSVTSNVANLTVKGPPTIVSQPLTQIAKIGQLATFSVVATDPGLITYQWKRNGQIIPGATGSTLTLQSVSLSDQGYYEVVLSNAVASAHSYFNLNVASVSVDGTTVVAWGTNPYGAAVVPSGLSKVVAIAAGDNHCVALKSDGTVAGWGLSNWGALLFPSGLSGVVAVGAGTYHTLLLKSDGTVVSLGNYGNAPPAVPAGLRNVVAISTRGTNNLALKSDGSVVGWGGPSGFAMPGDLSGVVRIAAGTLHCLAQKADGTLVAWGSNTDGQASVPAGLNGVIGISAGDRHSLALKSDGTVVAWGRNYYGQCNVPSGLTGVVAVSGGTDHSLALKSNGGVVVWGGSTVLPTGLGEILAVASGGVDLAIARAAAPTIVSQPTSQYANQGNDLTLTVETQATPLPTYQWYKDGVAIAGATSSSLVISKAQASNAGAYTVVVKNSLGSVTSSVAQVNVTAPAKIAVRPLSKRALVGDAVKFVVQSGDPGTISYQWKHNGQVISGAGTNSLDIVSAALTDRGFYEVKLTNSLGGSASSYFQLHVAPPRSSILAWGFNRDLQCNVPFGLCDVQAAVGGMSFSAALKTDGTVVTWGGLAAAVPMMLSDVVAIAAGEAHMLALKSDGTVVAWGRSAEGESTVPSDLREVVAVAAGYYYSMALKADGTVVTWGSSDGHADLKDIVAISARYSDDMELRSDGRVVGSTDVPYAATSGVIAVAAGDGHKLALRSDGLLVAWGNSNYSLDQVPTGLSNVVAISAGYNHNIALKADGTVQVWGYTGNGEGTFPAGMHNVVAVAAGGSHNLAMVTGYAPRITIQPVSKVAALGDNVTFSVAVDGVGPFSYQWYQDGQPLTGATASTLTISNAQIAHSGVYTVKVSCPYGITLSQTASLSGPNPSPTITVQPQPLSITTNQHLTLGVSGTGMGNLTYQWFRCGIPIPGANSANIDLGQASLLQNGTDFSVAVFDGLSRTISKTVAATVAPPSYPAVVTADPAFAPTFEIQKGTIKKIVRSKDGKLYAAGVFSRLSGVATWNVVRLTTSGDIDSSFSAPASNAAVNTLAVQDDGKVLIGGIFTLINGRNLAGLARLDRDGSLDATFSPSDNFSVPGVSSISIQPDGYILVGGGFSAGNGLVRLKPDGVRDTTFSNNSLNGAFGGIYSTDVQSDGKIIVGGWYGGLGGAAAGGLARLNSDGTIDASFNAGRGPNGSVKSVKVLKDGRILAGGQFYAFDGVNGSGIVRLLATGSVDPTWTSGAGFTFFSYDRGIENIEVQADDSALVAGSVFKYNGAFCPSCVRLLPDGTMDASFVSQASGGGGFAVSYFDDGKVLVGGNTLSLLGKTGNKLNDSQWGIPLSPYGPGLLALPGGKIFAFGDFEYVNGVSRKYLARLNKDGSVDSGFSSAGLASISSVSNALVQLDGRIVLLARKLVNGSAIPILARLNDDGSQDSTYQPDLTGYWHYDPPRIFTLSKGRLLVFCQNQSDGLSYFIRLKADGSRDISFRAPYLYISYGYAEQPDGGVIVKRISEGYQDLSSNPIARLKPDGSWDSSYAPSTDGSVNAMVCQANGQLLLGGDFTKVNGSSRPKIARLNVDGSLDSSFHPDLGPDGTVVSFRLQTDGRILVSGRFTSIDGTANTAYLARLNSDGTVDSSFSMIGINGAPASVVMQDDGTLLLLGGGSPVYSSDYFPGFQQYGLVRTMATTMSSLSFLSQPKNVAVAVGKPATFSVSVLGDSTPSYQWTKDGVALANGGDVSGARTKTLSVVNVTSNNAGSYAVAVTGKNGTITSNAAILTVVPAITITSQPKGQVIKEGDKLTLGVAATGTGNLGYQWKRDGMQLAGAFGPTLTYASATNNETGIYTVVITGLYDSVESQAATVVVGDLPPLPTLISQPVTQTLVGGSKLSLSVSATGTGTLSYLWKKDGLAIPGATEATYVVDTVGSANAGTYTVVVTGIGGSVESQTAVVTVNNAGRLTALAVRNFCGTEDKVVIAGYIIKGPGTKRLVMRGVGPNMKKDNVSNVLQDPLLKAVLPNGDELARNDNWSGDDGHTYGPAALDVGSKDSVLYINQGEGVYMSILSGVGDTTGEAMIEVYDCDSLGSSARFSALSVRAQIEPGQYVIPGVVISGSSPRKLIIRAIGPSLSQVNVSNGLPDPKIEVYSAGKKILENDDWSNEDGSSIELMALPKGSKDAVIVAEFEPGGYSVLVSGSGAKGGMVLIEAYEMP